MLAMTVRPAADLGLEDPHEVLLGGRIDPGHRLVEQIEVRPGGHRLGQEDPTPLSAGQGPDLAAVLTGHVDRREGLAHRVSVLPRRRATDPDQRDPAHHHDIADGDREAPIDELGLGHVGDPPCGAAGWCPEHLDRSSDGLDEAGDRLEQRALAGAVRADHGEQRTGLDLDVDVVQRDARPVGDGHVAHPNDGAQPPPAGRGWARLRARGHRHCRAFTISSTSQVSIPM